MQNSRLLFWGSFGGAIVVVVIIVGFLFLKDSNRMADLEKKYPDWKTVEGGINSFEARIPGEPEYASQELPIADSDQKIQQEIYVSGDENMSYFLSATLYPEEITGDEEENLRQALDGIVQAVSGGEVVFSSYKVPLSGANYLEYKITSADRSTSYKGRILLSSSSLYQVYVSYAESAYDDDKYTYFTNSFQVK